MEKHLLTTDVICWNLMAIINDDFEDLSKGKGCEAVAGWGMQR